MPAAYLVERREAYAAAAAPTLRRLISVAVAQYRLASSLVRHSPYEVERHSHG